MRPLIGRRRFLNYAAAGLSMTALPAIAARADRRSAGRRSRPVPDEFSVAAPVSIDVNARPLPSFDTRDRSRVRFGALEYRSGLISDLAVSRLWRIVGPAAGCQGRALHRHQRQGRLVHRPHRLQGPRDDRARRCRGLADARARRQADYVARLVRYRGDRARRLAGLCRHRTRQPDPAVRFCQGIYACAWRTRSVAAGGAQAALQQGDRGAGDGAEGLASGGNADRDLRTRSRRAGQHHRLS